MLLIYNAIYTVKTVWTFSPCREYGIAMASNSSSFEFTAAIRGYHVYQKIWQPELNETVCIHERRNEFDAFSVKTVRAADNATVWHLPKELSQQTKYLFDRYATVEVVITSS